MKSSTPENTSTSNNPFARIRGEVHKRIVGQEYLIERLLVALIADGHVLLEGVPGLAKTKTLSALTTAIAADMKRIQFTPDLLPSDIVGTEVYRPNTGDFVIRRGPVFTNLLLADEVNRAPAKVQSALLQAMQERQVTIGEHTFALPAPFLVLATQNPLEQEGTYPLPEAQVDRFMMKIKVGYPSFDEEVSIVKQESSNQQDTAPISPVISLTELTDLRKQSFDVYVDPKVDQYIVSLVQSTRDTDGFGLKGMVDWGASPRASIALKSCARALAFVRGRAFVTPDDVKELAPDVLRHRIIVSFDADARNIDSDEVIRVLLKGVTVP